MPALCTKTKQCLELQPQRLKLDDWLTDLQQEERASSLIQNYERKALKLQGLQAQLEGCTADVFY